MFKKEKKAKTEDTALQNATDTSAENAKEAPAKKATYKYDENTKSGVYVDQAEAEAFLEKQRKTKLRNRIITTIVSVVIIALVVFIAFNVILGGNSGLIDFGKDYLTVAKAAEVGESVDVTAGETLFASKTDADGYTTELWYSPKDTLLLIKILKDGNIVDVLRSWPEPTADEADPANPGKYPVDKHANITSLVHIRYSVSDQDAGNGGGINMFNDVNKNGAKHTSEINAIKDGFRIKYILECKDVVANSENSVLTGGSSSTKNDSASTEAPVDGTSTENPESTAVAPTSNPTSSNSKLVTTKISFVVEFTLDESGDLVVNIPRDEIDEPLLQERIEDDDEDMDKSPRFASITVLPYFDAAKQGDEGYFVTPDGSGALTYFDVDNRVINTDEYSKRVYGYDDTFDSTATVTPNLANEYVMMPAFGIIKDNSMVVGFVEEGEAQTTLTVGMPGDKKGVGHYYVNFSYSLRQYYLAKQGNGGKAYSFLEVESAVGDYKIRYSIDVNNEEEKPFSYVDVANVTRDNLLAKWETDAKVYPYLQEYINSLDGESGEPADVLHVKLFMGAVNESAVSMFSQLKVMTTFNDAKSIIDEFYTSGKQDIRYSLLGWQNDGYYGNNTKKFSIESDLGGKSDLKELNDWAEEKGVKLSADNNLLIIYGKPKAGISLRNAVVKTPGYEYLNYKIANNSGTFMTGTEFYYMSPLFYNEKLLEKDLEGLDKLGFNSVALQQVGDLLYTDYNKENALLRQQAIEYYRIWISEFKKELGEAAVYYGFDFAASVADTIYDMPTESSRLFQMDQEIPFIQIVYHGLVDYYSEPVNRTAQDEYATLKAIEFGSFVTYEVTENLTEELKYTKYNSLFKSCIDDLKDSINKGYDLASKTVGTVSDALITDHYCVDGERTGNVYCTEYSNGVKVYVNYGDAEYAIEGVGTVPALGVGVSNAEGYNSVASLK